MKFNILAISVVSAATLLSSCKKDNEDQTPANTAKALTTYANIAQAVYDDSYTTAVDLRNKIDAFAANPSQANLDACKAAWKAARIPYGQSEGFRFYGGPIDADPDGPEGLINGWPVDESYIDYTMNDAGVENTDTISIVGRPDMWGDVTTNLIQDKNEKDAETEITTGYHAIEFLLWGQDFYADGPGRRPLTDFTTRANASRRLQYLKVASALLVQNLDQVRKAWLPTADYRINFLKSANASQSLNDVFKGIGTLAKGELANERMRTAMQNGDQEDEHSCFSDNTHIDIQGNFHSIRNIYKGSYTRVDGTVVSGYSLAELVKSKNSDRDQTVQDDLTTTQANIDKIEVPFDQAILNDKTDIDTSVRSLEKIGDDLVNAAQALGLSVNIDG